MQVKTNITYNAAKLEKQFHKIVDKLSADLAKNAFKFIKKNTAKGKDIFGKDFAPLSPRTKRLKSKKQGYYKNAKQNKTLIATGDMLNKKMKLIFDIDNMTNGIEVRGYGTYHLKKQKNTPKREWFGASKFLLKNIIDNKKLSTFRRDISKAFKK